MKNTHSIAVIATIFVGLILSWTAHASEDIFSDFSAAIESNTSAVSNEDIILYKHIKASTSEQFLRKIAIFTQKMTEKTRFMNQIQKNAYYDAWMKKIDSTILALTGQYYKELTLPREVNAKYLVLKLLKLEINLNLKHGLNVQ